jgi:hypothetical protein
MAFSGMDLGAAEQLASSVELYVEQVERIKQRLVQRVTDLDWWGPDAQAFKSEDLAEICRVALQMTTSANHIATACRDNLVAQREVSRS